jgi:hypothetical protein
VPHKSDFPGPMETGKWSKGTLRIISNIHSVKQITAVLGLEPDKGFDKGMLANPRNIKSQRRDASVWLLESGLGSDRPPEEHIVALLDKIASVRDSVRLLAGSDTIELLLGYGSEAGQGGCVIESKLLKELADLGLDLVLDLYPPTVADALNCG